MAIAASLKLCWSSCSSCLCLLWDGSVDERVESDSISDGGEVEEAEQLDAATWGTQIHRCTADRCPAGSRWLAGVVAGTRGKVSRDD
jgi:hypothetical protein